VQELSHRDVFRLRHAMASVGSDSFFTSFRKLLRGRLHFDTFLMMRFDAGNAPTLLGTWKRLGATPPHVLGEYLDRAYRLDPFYQFTDVPTQGGLYRLCDIAPDRFFSSEYFYKYFKETRLLDEVGLLAPLSCGSVVHLSFSRLERSGQYRRREIQCLQDYSPILLELLVSHGRSLPLAGVSPQEQTRVSALHELILDEANEAFQAGLTRREAQIAGLVLLGHSNGSAAQMLNISRETVKVHRRNLYSKLRISSSGSLFEMLRHLL
jgi:DNA-binding CsgD family transcriptional regulator